MIRACLLLALGLIAFATTPLQARDYLKSERAQSRGFSPGRRHRRRQDDLDFRTDRPCR